MAQIEKFLGRTAQIPEDRKYYARHGLWCIKENEILIFGMTEPFLILSGGFKEPDSLVGEGKHIQAGDAVLFAITGKILYIESPVSGVISFNSEIKRNPKLVEQDPYRQGWLFSIKMDNENYSSGADANAYIESLKTSEGFKNPEGLKGGISSICKAVYSGIREQKLG